MSESPSGPRQRLLSLRGLVPFLRPHRALLFGWLGALAVSSSSTLFFPWAFKQVIDQGFASGSGGSIDRWFLLLFGVAVVLAMATAARFFCVWAAFLVLVMSFSYPQAQVSVAHRALPHRPCSCSIN